MLTHFVSVISCCIEVATQGSYNSSAKSTSNQLCCQVANTFQEKCQWSLLFLYLLSLHWFLVVLHPTHPSLPLPNFTAHSASRLYSNCANGHFLQLCILVHCLSGVSRIFYRKKRAAPLGLSLVILH